MCFVGNSRDARSAKPLNQRTQLPQPPRIQHRHRALRSTDTKHVCRIGADRARRAIRQIDHQQQHAVPALKRPGLQQAPEQWMCLRDHPHVAPATPHATVAVCRLHSRHRQNPPRDRDRAAVVLDIKLPRLYGWQVLAELKADPATAAIRVVIASVVDDRPRAWPSVRTCISSSRCVATTWSMRCDAVGALVTSESS